MRIEQLDPEHTERFLVYRSAALSADPDSFRFAVSDDTVVGVEAWRKRLSKDHVVVVCNDGQWIGVGGLTRLTGAKLAHKGLIWGMHVVPEERGSGAAKLIMTALIEQARGRMRQLQLTVMADNARAIAFYRRFGFEQYGSEPASVLRDGGYADELLMWRLVQDGKRSPGAVFLPRLGEAE